MKVPVMEKGKDDVPQVPQRDKKKAGKGWELYLENWGQVQYDRLDIQVYTR